jgi:hypothetical protein
MTLRRTRHLRRRSRSLLSLKRNRLHSQHQRKPNSQRRRIRSLKDLRYHLRRNINSQLMKNLSLILRLHLRKKLKYLEASVRMQASLKT